MFQSKVLYSCGGGRAGAKMLRWGGGTVGAMVGPWTKKSSARRTPTVIGSAAGREKRCTRKPGGQETWRRSRVPNKNKKPGGQKKFFRQPSPTVEEKGGEKTATKSVTENLEQPQTVRTYLNLFEGVNDTTRGIRDLSQKHQRGLLGAKTRCAEGKHPPK